MSTSSSHCSSKIATSPELLSREDVLDVRSDLLLPAVGDEPSDAGPDTRSRRRHSRSRAGGKIRPTTAPPTAPHFAPLRVLVKVVVDVDLAVGPATDENQAVNLDHVVLGKLLERVPILACCIGIRVRSDIADRPAAHLSMP